MSQRITALSPAERAAFVREANLRGTAAETLPEQARGDVAAARAALPHWRGGDVEAAANRDFVRAFLDRLTPEERAGLLDAQGAPTPALIARIERALMEAAYGDALAPVLERLWLGRDEGLRGLAAALRRAAGDWAAMRAEIAAGRVPADYDATPALAEAVAALAEAQQRRIRLAELIEQVDIERPAMTPAGRAMLASWFPDGDLARRIKGQDRIAELLRGYVARARAADAGPALFDLPPVRTEDTLAALARADDGARAADQPAPPPTRAAEPEPEAPPPPTRAPEEPGREVEPRVGEAPPSARDVDLSTMPTAILKQEIARAEKADSAVTLALIERGRGSEKWSETRARAQQGDPLARHAVEVYDWLNALRSQLEYRRRAHGKDSPVRGGRQGGAAQPHIARRPQSMTPPKAPSPERALEDTLAAGVRAVDDAPGAAEPQAAPAAAQPGTVNTKSH